MFLLFDLDGTLLNTLPSIAASINRMLTARGFSATSVERVRALVGNGSGRLVAGVLAEAGGPGPDREPEIFKAALDAYNADYLSHPIEGTAPYPGILELFAFLKEKNIPFGILSNKPDPIVHEVANHVFGSGLFVQGAREDVPRKPNPAAVFQMACEAGHALEETIYIGDSEVDVATARNAGIPIWLVTYGFRTAKELEKETPDRWFHDVAALRTEILARWEKEAENERK